MNLHEAQAEIMKGHRLFKAFEKAAEVIDAALVCEQSVAETKARLAVLKDEAAMAAGGVATAKAEAEKIRADAEAVVADARKRADAIVADAHAKAREVEAKAKAEADKHFKTAQNAQADVIEANRRMNAVRDSVAALRTEEAALRARIDAAKAKALEAFKA